MVVADTGPVNYLVWIGTVEVLPALYGRVALPEGVVHELSAPRAPEPVRDWMASLPEWIEVHDPGEMDPRLRALGTGEREVINLAIRTGLDTVLMDDFEGREAAKTLGLVAIRTLAILARASEQDLLHLPTALERLPKTSFRARPAHCRAVLEHASRHGP